MPDFKKMTLQSLRELARKKLGPGHSRLKTKAEIVEALEAGAGGEEAEEKASPAARTPGARARAAGTKPAEPAGKAVRAVKEVGKAARAGVRAAVRVGKAAAEGAAEGARAAKEAARGTKGGKLRKAAAVAAGAAAGGAAAARRSARPGEGLPDPEGYFVARVRGEEAMRDAPHAMTETGSDGPLGAGAEGVGAPKWDERLGELPWGYGDDAFVALPRDPTSLFLYWDLGGETVSRGFEGLDHGRAQLWLFVQAGAGWERVRVLEFALESRGYYLHDLEPGRTYRAEIHAVDRRGTERLVGRASNEVRLPPVGPSPIIDDRFVRIPWDMPLGRLLGPGHPGAPFSDEARALLARLSDWSRFSGPTWGSAGGIGGRPFSPTSSPGGKPGPQGGGEGR